MKLKLDIEYISCSGRLNHVTTKTLANSKHFMYDCLCSIEIKDIKINVANVYVLTKEI